MSNNVPNKIILSPHDIYYLDCGLGNLWGGGSWCGNYKTWANLYSYELDYNFDAKNKHKILGGELCAWGELNNDDNIELNLFPRAITVAEKWWSKPFKKFI